MIGVCVDDIASPLVAANDIAGETMGSASMTSGANVVGNRVHDGSVVGIYVETGIAATITLNHMFDNNLCELPRDSSTAVASRWPGVPGAGVSEPQRHRGGHVAADGLPAVRLTDDVGVGNTGTRPRRVRRRDHPQPDRRQHPGREVDGHRTQPHRQQPVRHVRPGRSLQLTAGAVRVPVGGPGPGPLPFAPPRGSRVPRRLGCRRGRSACGRCRGCRGATMSLVSSRVDRRCNRDVHHRDSGETRTSDRSAEDGCWPPSAYHDVDRDRRVR